MTNKDHFTTVCTAFETIYDCFHIMTCFLFFFSSFLLRSTSASHNIMSCPFGLPRFVPVIISKTDQRLLLLLLLLFYFCPDTSHLHVYTTKQIPQQVCFYSYFVHIFSYFLFFYYTTFVLFFFLFICFFYSHCHWIYNQPGYLLSVTISTAQQ